MDAEVEQVLLQLLLVVDALLQTAQVLVLQNGLDQQRVLFEVLRTRGRPRNAGASVCRRASAAIEEPRTCWTSNGVGAGGSSAMCTAAVGDSAECFYTLVNACWCIVLKCRARPRVCVYVPVALGFADFVVICAREPGCAMHGAQAPPLVYGLL